MFNIYSIKNIFKWFLLVVGLSRLIPMACPPDKPQKTLNSRIKFSFNHNNNEAPQTWTELPNTFDVGRFGHTVAQIGITTNSSDSNTSKTGGRRDESDFSFSYQPQNPPNAAHIAFLDGHNADEQAPVWLWVQDSDVVLTGTLACVTITNVQPSSDQNGVLNYAITTNPNYKPSYYEAEPVTLP